MANFPIIKQLIRQIRCRSGIIFSRLVFVFIAAAFQHVQSNLSELESSANETDLVFLKGLLDNPAVKQLIQVRHEDHIHYDNSLPFDFMFISDIKEVEQYRQSLAS